MVPMGLGSQTLLWLSLTSEITFPRNGKKTDYYSNFVYAGNPIAPVEFEYVFKFGDDRAQQGKETPFSRNNWRNTLFICCHNSW